MLPSELDDLLASNESKDLLRLLTCGSVDDGKSTLIGRLLHDSLGIYEDQLQSLRSDSKRVGSAGQAIDFSLLLDGLKAEREQGITIDVAYRYFSTPRRKFIIADCPGHVQYTRNMVTGGSTANLAIVLIDATRGVLEQTRRHSFIVSLLDIGHVIVAVNKMDLVGYSQQVFDDIRADYAQFATRLDVRSVDFIPLSGLNGDNVVERSAAMPWYQGAPLLHKLETVHIASDRNFIDLRFPVQYVIRHDRNYRGYAGTVASGVLHAGAEVLVLPSRQRTRIERIDTYDGPLDVAFPPMAVTVSVSDDIDISRGDTIVAVKNVPRSRTDLDALVVWMAQAPLEKERPYVLKHCSSEARAEIRAIEYQFDVNSLSRMEADSLALNEIGRVSIRLSQALCCDPYKRNHATGSFILIDPESGATVGAGMILDRVTDEQADAAGATDALHRTTLRHKSTIEPGEHADRAGHPAATLWLTGLPGSGKTTTAFALERELFDAGWRVRVLDAESLRLGISDDLGFGVLERSESVRRAAHIARMFNDVGVMVIVALVSPYRVDREEAKRIIEADRFVEVHVSTPLAVCEQRDSSGVYARARAGTVSRFTGISAPYEAPEGPEISLSLDSTSTAEAVAQLVATLARRGIAKTR